MVECTGLENRRRLTPPVSSNLTASAKTYKNCSSDMSDKHLKLLEIKGLKCLNFEPFFS